ncbi:hypothetical protein [Leuconostoc pseudomesenteroides]|uniref:hypothetical protein n=1 Tax=Leuconostoc pseudomesenteroides TaxID=33968 RepID=UPI0039ED4779
MKKTLFMQTFNLNCNLLFLSTFGFLFTLISGALQSNIEFLRQLESMNNILIYFDKIREFIFLGSTFLTVLFLISIFMVIISRIEQDKFTNYFKSIIETFRLRRFTGQSQQVETQENGSLLKTTLNPVNRDFNRAVNKCIVEITKNGVFVVIKIPQPQQAQKILKDMESQLKEEIASRNPDFYFSSPRRIKNYLWITGSKR